MTSPPKGKRARLVNLTQVGQRVRDCREQHDWSQMDLAGRIESAQSWLSELERGQHKSMEVDTVFKLAREFGVSTDYLLGITDDPTPPRRASRTRQKETHGQP